MIKRYNEIDQPNAVYEWGMEEDKKGEWVKYKDIKHILERSDNRGGMMFTVRNKETDEDVTNDYYWYISQDGSLWHQPKASHTGLFKTNMDMFEYILERSYTSGYAVQPMASPKLPSFENVIKELQKEWGDDTLSLRIIRDLYDAIKKLGNFS